MMRIEGSRKHVDEQDVTVLANAAAPESRDQRIVSGRFDPEFTHSLVLNVLDHISECYYRTEFIGFDEYPERNQPDRPLVFASNHSGMAFPWDGIMFTAGLFRKHHYDLSKSVRALAAPMLSQSILMNPFLIEDFWKRAGAVDASFAKFEIMMHQSQSNLLVYPEGVPGIGKGFTKRYQLQRFATSFVRLSLKYRTDIIPFSTVNGEYINPHTYHSDTINKMVNRIGIPFLPIGLIMLFLPFQPWMFYFGFPAKLTYVRGKRIKPYEMLDKPYEHISQEEIYTLTGTIKQQMQTELRNAARKYGKKPYAAREFLTACRKNARKFPFFLPFFWPSVFTEFERLYRQGKGNPTMKLGLKAGVRAFWKNPMMFAFFLPIVGWIPILIRGFSKRGRS